MSKEQAVATESDTETKPQNEESSAQEDELSTLLNEWDKPKEQAQPKEVDNKARLEYLEREYTNIVVDREISDIREMVPGLPADYSSTIIEKEVQSDQRLVELFQERRNRPQDWAKAKQAIANKLNKAFPQVADEDTEAVVAAVKSASKPSTETQSTPDVKRMNHEEFQEWQADMLGGR